MNIKDIRITKDRIDATKPLFRVGEYTTNSFWLLASKYESKLTRTIETANRQPTEENMKRILPIVENQKMVIGVNDTLIEDKASYPVVEIKIDNNKKIYVNAYYYKYIANNMPSDAILSRSTDNPYIAHTYPLTWVKDNKIIGIIMPININR